MFSWQESAQLGIPGQDQGLPSVWGKLMMVIEIVIVFIIVIVIIAIVVIYIILTEPGGRVARIARAGQDFINHISPLMGGPLCENKIWHCYIISVT